MENLDSTHPLAMDIVFENDTRIIKINLKENIKTVQFLVYIKGQEFPYWSIGFPYNPQKELKDQEVYTKSIESIKENILPIDPFNFEDWRTFDDYGIANGWTSESSINNRPKLFQKKEDLSRNKYLCNFEISMNIGPCQTRIINYTYKYTFTYDSSD